MMRPIGHINYCISWNTIGGFLDDQAFCVIVIFRGFGIRMKAESFNEVLKTLRFDDFRFFVWKILDLFRFFLVCANAVCNDFLEIGR